MLKHLGRLVWSHTRDMSVLNYKTAMVYQIYTAEGYLYLKIDKATGATYIERGAASVMSYILREIHLVN
jgi:hypothetical protein